MSWSVDDVPVVGDEVAAHVPGDGSDIVLFHGGQRRWYRLAGTASAIWSAIDGVRTVGDIVEMVAADYGVDAGGIVDDVVAALETLGSDGLLR